MQRTCARSDCGRSFDVKTHNQRYCDDECCRLATNQRIKERYHEKKAIRSGKERKCVTCTTRLSRYNDSAECRPCQNSKTSMLRTEFLELVGA